MSAPKEHGIGRFAEALICSRYRARNHYGANRREPPFSLYPMKITVHTCRILLGLMFTIFGLNGFLNFMTMPPPTGLAGQFMGALFASNYLVAVCALEVITGVLLLANRFAPLALATLAPILVNIALYHALMAPQSAGPAVLAIVLWLFLVYRERASFSSLLLKRGVE